MGWSGTGEIFWPPPPPSTSLKSISLDRKSSKSTLKSCHRMLSESDDLWQGCGWGRTEFSLRGWPLRVWPCSSECMRQHKLDLLIFLLVFIFSFFFFSGGGGITRVEGRPGRTGKWVGLGLMILKSWTINTNIMKKYWHLSADVPMSIGILLHLPLNHPAPYHNQPTFSSVKCLFMSHS